MCKLVMIEWVDSVQPLPSWVHLSDFEPDSELKCFSVGWLIHDGDDMKCLAPNSAAIGAKITNKGTFRELDTDGVQVSGIIHIPSKCVVKVVNLIDVDPQG